MEREYELKQEWWAWMVIETGGECGFVILVSLLLYMFGNVYKVNIFKLLK